MQFLILSIYSVTPIFALILNGFSFSSFFSFSQPPASPSTQEAIQGMLSMANLQSSDSCLQPSWGTNQAKNNSMSAPNSKKSGSSNSKNAGKRLLKKTAKNNIDIEDYYEDQDHLDACFKDSDYGMKILLKFSPGQ